MGCKGPDLTYRQRQVARQTAHANRRAINVDVDAVLDYVDGEAKCLSQKHHHAIAWFQHQFYQGGRVVRMRHAVSVYNAAQQINGFLDGRKGGMCPPSYYD